MAHNNHTIYRTNQDTFRTKTEWLNMTGDWEDPFGLPSVEEHEGVMVVRDDKVIGSKCRFADLLVSRVKERVLVYVQPRIGLAGLSLLHVAKKYNKEVVLWMPASKQVSNHQAACIEMGATPKFKRIAAMPVLNSHAKKWAEENGAYFIPLGLKHELVTACGIRVCHDLVKRYGYPRRMFSAVSTGVLARALQIGFDYSAHTIVAVARNLKDGERGWADVISEPLPFSSEEKQENLPPFPSVKTYDAKVWKYIPKSPGMWMWNVGADPAQPSNEIFQSTNSYREWGE